MQAFVISGPTAVGKGTVLKELLARAPQLWYSISATTRPARPGESDGVDYYFVSDEQFDEMVESGSMLEWAVVHRMHRYGTPRKPVEDALAAGKTVILELDLAGARQVRESMPEAIQIFLAPPSFEDLQYRLRARGTETQEDQQRRLETAKVELAAESEFDYIVVNDTVAQATDELLQILGVDE
ncbi:guanylate kinase [Arcanobacterium wilhelmae]|nr:guanylate kinase [Arcanobacterium wilhelmae]WFN91146.1 guanylate kinase [Arcanobacterium wilhelmae]